MCETKVCKKCNVEKPLSEYRFHQGYYPNTCKECQKISRRAKNSTFIDEVFIQKKKCGRCGEIKLRTGDNFSFINKKGGYRKYKKMCKVCEAEFKSVMKTRTRIIVEPSEDVRICRKCNIQKNVGEFYPLSSGFNNYCCIKCESKRKKDRKEMMTPEEKEKFDKNHREYHQQKRDYHLHRTYAEFDFSRNYDNDITKEYIKESLNKSCSYCGFPSTGLDRKENSIGHTIENCVPCCSECNSARMDNFTYKEMIDYIGPAIKEAKESRIDSEKFLEAVKLILK